MRTLRRLVCRLIGHHVITVLEGVRLTHVSVSADLRHYGIGGVATARHHECRRCGDRLETL